MTPQNINVKLNNIAIKEINKKAAKNGKQIPRMRNDFVTVKKQTLKKWHNIYNMKQTTLRTHFKSKLRIQTYKSWKDLLRKIFKYAQGRRKYTL